MIELKLNTNNGVIKALNVVRKLYEFMLTKYSIPLLLISVVLLICPTCDQKKGKDIRPVTEIEFGQLVSEIGKYQGKVVQIKGLYVSGFEESAIYRANLNPDTATSNSLKKSRPIWVEFDIDWSQPKSQILKSLPRNNALVTLQGIIDTTNKGHFQQYAGALEKAKLISSD